MNKYFYLPITGFIGNKLYHTKKDTELYEFLKKCNINILHNYLLNRGFTYKKDYKLFDYIQSPENFCYSKTGDCDDFANLYFEILKHNNISCTMYILENEKSGHVVTMYGLNVYSNLNNYSGYNDIQEFNEHIYNNKYKNIYVLKEYKEK